MRFFEAIKDGADLEYAISNFFRILKIIAFALAFLMIGAAVAWHVKPEKKLTYEDRKNIAIDFMARGAWRYTLCHMPMDSNHQPEKGTTK